MYSGSGTEVFQGRPVCDWVDDSCGADAGFVGVTFRQREHTCETTSDELTADTNFGG